ncbi:MAG: LamG-like jellyroll fold domain-containing protein, partial [Phycisphaerae bacterium]
MTGELIGLWHLDEPDGPLAFDAVGDGGPLQIHGCMRRAGRFGMGLALQDPFDFARGQAPGAMPTGTVALWFKLQGRGGETCLVSIQERLKIVVRSADDEGICVLGGGARLASSQPVEPQRWYHVAVTWSAAGVDLYVDGRRVARDSRPRKGVRLGRGQDDYLAIGPAGVYRRFAAFTIDEVALFSRALTDRQIRQLCDGPLEPGGPPEPVAAAQPKAIDARQFIDPTDPTCGIQRAIDALGADGGVVTIPAGRYVLRRGLRLPSRATLIGQGRQTVLAARRPFSSSLAADARRGA